MSRLAALLIFGLVLGACGPRPNPAKSAQEGSNIKALALLYGRSLGANQGRPPSNEAAFKAFIHSLPPEQLKNFNVNDVDQLFISPRDGEPFVVVYGELKKTPGPAGAPVVAYERSGKEGKRYVVSSLGAVEEVDDTKFKQYLPSE